MGAVSTGAQERNPRAAESGLQNNQYGIRGLTVWTLGREPHPDRQYPNKAAVQQQTEATLRKGASHSKHSSYRINQSTMPKYEQSHLQFSSLLNRLPNQQTNRHLQQHETPQTGGEALEASREQQWQ